MCRSPLVILLISKRNVLEMFICNNECNFRTFMGQLNRRNCLQLNQAISDSRVYNKKQPNIINHDQNLSQIADQMISIDPCAADYFLSSQNLLTFSISSELSIKLLLFLRFIRIYFYLAVNVHYLFLISE